MLKETFQKQKRMWKKTTIFPYLESVKLAQHLLFVENVYTFIYASLRYVHSVLEKLCSLTNIKD